MQLLLVVRLKAALCCLHDAFLDTFPPADWRTLGALAVNVFCYFNSKIGFLKEEIWCLGLVWSMYRGNAGHFS